MDTLERVDEATVRREIETSILAPAVDQCLPRVDVEIVRLTGVNDGDDFLSAVLSADSLKCQAAIRRYAMPRGYRVETCDEVGVNGSSFGMDRTLVLRRLKRPVRLAENYTCTLFYWLSVFVMSGIMFWVLM